MLWSWTRDGITGSGGVGGGSGGGGGGAVSWVEVGRVCGRWVEILFAQVFAGQL